MSEPVLPFPELPGGTVTFLFTDIEGSTQLLQRLRRQYADLLEAQRSILRVAFATWGGHIVDTRGEEFFVAFQRATEAVSAAVQAQRGLANHPWPEDIQVRVRMGIHTGEPWVGEEGYVGMDVHRAARIANLGHGGQVLLSETAAALVIDELPEGVSLLDLGRHRLKDVPRMERVRQLVIDGLPGEFPPLKSLEQEPSSKRRRHNLPSDLTPFIGRRDELSAITGYLADPSIHLLTLLGVGGIGKTRLAIHAAAELVDDFPDGVWLVEFARLRDPKLVPQHTASVLGVSAHDALEGQDVGDVLINYLRDKRLLLLLDNCEHLIQACASLAERLLRECPQVQVLATSRESLGTPAEQLFNVPAMDVPVETTDADELKGSEAIQLFISRATAAVPMFKATVDNIGPIREICQHLDGIPLAIELAAARVKILAPEQIAELLSDRFQLLTGGPRTALPRHQTLKATLEWSFNLLTEPEQKLFTRVSVFSGGWTLEDVEGLLVDLDFTRTDLIELLSNLADKSLVTVTHIDGTTWYGMLETVHEYAAELLSSSGEIEAIRRKHAQYYRSLAEEGDPELRGADQLAWIKRLDGELENFRAALRWLIATDQADEAAQLVGDLGWFWFMNGNWLEARRWVMATLDMISEPAPLLRARAICRAGGIELIQGNLAGPPELIQEALATFTEHNDREGMAWCFNLLGQLATFAHARAEEGSANLKQSVELFRALDDRWGVAWSTRYLGQLAEINGDFELAVKLQQEALEVFTELGDVWNTAHSLFLIAGTYRDHGDYEVALKLYQESLENAGKIEDQVMAGHALQGLGMASVELRQLTMAKSWLHEALDIMERIGDENCTARTNLYLARVALGQGDHTIAEQHLKISILGFQKLKRNIGIAICLLQYVELATKAGQHIRAARLLGGISSVAESASAFQYAVWLKDREDHVAEMKQQLGDAEFEKAYGEGSKLLLDQVVAYALGEYAID